MDDGARDRGSSMAVVLNLYSLEFDLALRTIQGSTGFCDGALRVRKMTWVNREMA